MARGISHISYARVAHCTPAKTLKALSNEDISDDDEALECDLGSSPSRQQPTSDSPATPARDARPDTRLRGQPHKLPLVNDALACLPINLRNASTPHEKGSPQCKERAGIRQDIGDSENQHTTTPTASLNSCPVHLAQPRTLPDDAKASLDSPPIKLEKATGVLPVKDGSRGKVPAGTGEDYYYYDCYDECDFTEDHYTTRPAIPGNAGQDPWHIHCPRGGHGLEACDCDDYESSRIPTAIQERHLRTLADEARTSLSCSLIEPGRFQPLDPVQEEVSCLALDGSCVTSPHADDDPEGHDPLRDTIADSPIRDQIRKHLAGEFEWLMSYPPSSDSNEHDISTYGCNLLPPLRDRPARSSGDDGWLPADDSYLLLATPLEKRHDHSRPKMNKSRIAADCDLTDPKMLEIFRAIELEASRAAGDRGCCGNTAGSPRTQSVSQSRIEDSLEELDKLEEELEEAWNEAAHPRPNDISNTPPSAATVASRLGRAPFSGPYATMRVKTSDKAVPTVRRSASMTLSRARQGSDASASRTKAGVGSGQATTPRPSVKQTKALPGVEPREARQSQQTGVRKSAATTPKVRANKSLTTPTFELPGEAISRHKREEKEAKLRAQEEEERKRREFRARPIKLSSTPSSAPRETIASRARQAKIREENAEKQASAANNRAKRVSLVSPTRAARGSSSLTGGSGQQQTRRQNSVVSSSDDASQATSTWDGSKSGKRSSIICVVEEADQRLRGKEIYARDNLGFMAQKEREKRDREMAARMAREEAAERSRMASREWAEKRRRKGAASKEVRQPGAS